MAAWRLWWTKVRGGVCCSVRNFGHISPVRFREHNRRRSAAGQPRHQSRPASLPLPQTRQQRPLLARRQVSTNRSVAVGLDGDALRSLVCLVYFQEVRSDEGKRGADVPRSGEAAGVQCLCSGQKLLRSVRWDHLHRLDRRLQVSAERDAPRRNQRNRINASLFILHLQVFRGRKQRHVHVGFWRRALGQPDLLLPGGTQRRGGGVLLREG